MTSVTIDRASGVLVIGGETKLFPIGVSNPPPLGRKAPSGKEGLAELAEAGVNLIRTGIETWSLARLDMQLAAQRRWLDAAAHNGLRCWLWLGNAAVLTAPRGGEPPASARLLERIARTFSAHPGLGLYKGADEPANPFRGRFKIPPEPLVRALRRLRQLDPNHPLVIIQAPRGPVVALRPYRPAFDITGADIYPVSYPPGMHSDSPNHDISVVGDITRKMRDAAGGKPVWTTLQIAWSGVAPSKEHPQRVPRFPSLRQERFMAYQAIVAGARGLLFFGGHLTEVCTPDDARAGWNWKFWREALRPLVRELASPELRPALLVPDARTGVKVKPHTSGAGQVELVARRADGFLYVIAVRRGGDTTQVEFVGLPRKRSGGRITGGEVLFEYVQQPPPPPRRPANQVRRPIHVSNGAFRDWFGPHEVHVYRFPL